MTRIAVLGAGPAGLGAALRLARRGHAVTVLERAAAPGGLAASVEVAGLRVDQGSHRLHPSIAPDLLRDLTDLLDGDLQWRERAGRIVMHGRFVDFPLRPARALRALPVRTSAGIARDVLVAPARRARAETFAEIARVRVGSTLAREFYEPYARKLWDVEPRGLSAELARRRVGTQSGFDLVRRAMGRAPGRGGFWYPRRGFGQITEVLAAAAERAGARIMTGADVTRVEPHAERVTVSVAGGEVLAVDVVLSTVPLPVLASLAGAPESVLAAARGLEHRALVLAYLVLEQPSWTEFDAHYFPGPEVRASRVSEPKRYRRSGDDPPGVTVLCAEVPCSVGDATWRASSDELGAVLAGELAAAGLPPVRPAAVELRRVERAYPVYRVGYERQLDVIQQWTAGLARVLSFGRQGLFAHDNTHHALAMARAAADCVTTEGAVDRERWAEALDDFSSHVVED